MDTAFDRVLDACARPREAQDGVWITPRLRALYLDLHAEGWAHSFELWTPDGDLGAGLLCVAIGRAAMLESMRRVHPHAGNALLSRTLDRLAVAGAQLCDIQTLTPHTERLGARLVPRAAYERRLDAATGFTGA
jgi:leucyl/phenylalanyl-tRNA--protein transferase